MLGAIEPLRFPTMRTAKGGSIAPIFSEGFLSEHLVLSSRCTAVLPIGSTDNKEGRFDSTIFSEGFPFQKYWCYRTSVMLCYPLQLLTTKRGGSIATIFLKGAIEPLPTKRTEGWFDGTKFS